GLGEYRRVPIGGDPVDADALIRAYLPSPQLHRAGGAATIVHQRAVDTQYLVVGLPQQIGILPQQLLNLGFTGQEVGDDAYRRSYGAYLPPRSSCAAGWLSPDHSEGGLPPAPASEHRSGHAPGRCWRVARPAGCLSMPRTPPPGPPAPGGPGAGWRDCCALPSSAAAPAGSVASPSRRTGCAGRRAGRSWR